MNSNYPERSRRTRFYLVRQRCSEVRQNSPDEWPGEKGTEHVPKQKRHRYYLAARPVTNAVLSFENEFWRSSFTPVFVRELELLFSYFLVHWKRSKGTLLERRSCSRCLLFCLTLSFPLSFYANEPPLFFFRFLSFPNYSFFRRCKVSEHSFLVVVSGMRTFTLTIPAVTTSEALCGWFFCSCVFFSSFRVVGFFKRPIVCVRSVFCPLEFGGHK